MPSTEYSLSCAWSNVPCPDTSEHPHGGMKYSVYEQVFSGLHLHKLELRSTAVVWKACSLVIYHSALTKHGCNAPGVSEDSHTQPESVLLAHGQGEAGPGQFASSQLRAAWHFCPSTKSLWMQSSSAVKCQLGGGGGGTQTICRKPRKLQENCSWRHQF